MPAFVRKNAIVLTASFTADDGTATQPSAVIGRLNYKDLSGSPAVADLTFTYDPTSNTWNAIWDSNVAGRGTVTWVVYGTGTLQAAMEGCFDILANSANTI